MTQVVIPSEDKSITEAQIGKILQDIGAALRKSKLSSSGVQQIIENQMAVLTSDIVSSIQKRVEAASDLIVRCVPVIRHQTGERALKATGRNLYVNTDVVKTMPNGEDDEVEVIFFKVGRWISDDDLEKEYDLRGLKSADPFSVAAVNEADPAFADDRPNSTHWRDTKGKWCFAAFDGWGGERRVGVSRGKGGCADAWWFAGVRK